METLFFWIFATLTLGGAVSCVLRRNPLMSAISLIGTFIGLAGLYLLNGAPFIGAMQIMVYAGAIMVLVVFVIMFLNLPESELKEEKISRSGVFLVFFLLAPLTALCIGTMTSGESGEVAEVSEDFGAIETVGQQLFNDHLFEFEAVSILLLTAIVGAVMLAKKRL